MAITLDDLVKAYVEDEDYQKTRSELAEKRDASIPHLQAVTQSFLRTEINLKTFCPQLEKTLRTEEDWGAMGFGFMMELNKLSKHHNDANALAEEHFRRILTGLKTSNLGERIEEFYTFLLKERERLRREGKASGMIVPARRSPFIISLWHRFSQFHVGRASAERTITLASTRADEKTDAWLYELWIAKERPL